MSDKPNPNAEVMLQALAKSLASHALPENQISEIASAISEARWPVVGYDICTVGICLDHRWEGELRDIDLSDFTDERLGSIRNIEIFPEGIILPDRVRLRTTHSL